MPEALPPLVALRLKALSRRVLSVAWIQGLLCAGIAVCLLALAQGALDWLFDLSRGVRILFALGDLAILGLIAFRFWVHPWRRRLTPDEAALRAERHWPELRSGLISAVQLARRPAGSPAIVKALLVKMAARVADFDLRAAAPWGRLARLFLLAAILLAITAGLAAWLAPRSLVLLQRIALLNVPLPTETIVIAVTKDLAIPSGQSVELAAKAQGVIPRSGRVEVAYEGRKAETVSVIPKGSSPETFSLPLANIQQPFTYRFFLNDGRGEEWKVRLIHPPVVKDIQFDVTSPDYTGLPPTRLLPGNLNILAGSKLKISGHSDQPLKSARLILEGANRSVEIKPQGADRMAFETTLEIPKGGLSGVSVELRNDQDTVSQENTVYALQVLPDKAPEIVLPEGWPEKASFIATQKPRLRFEVRDDFKVQQVFLCVQALNSLGEGEEPSPEKAKEISIPLPQPGARIAFDYEWSEPGKAADWAEGQSFAWWIKAVDNNAVTGPGVTYSAPGQWSVVSLQTKREELAEQLRKNAESIKDLSGAQESVRKSLGEWLKQDHKR